MPKDFDRLGVLKSGDGKLQEYETDSGVLHLQGDYSQEEEDSQEADYIQGGQEEQEDQEDYIQGEGQEDYIREEEEEGCTLKGLIILNTKFLRYPKFLNNHRYPKFLNNHNHSHHRDPKYLEYNNRNPCLRNHSLSRNLNLSHNHNLL